MLKDLLIRHFAIIDEVVLHFDKGLTIVTGETGAGKSILIDAVHLLLGGRANKEMIRYGYDKSLIQASFSLKKANKVVEIAESMGIDLTDDLLIISRELSLKGSNLIRANGLMITLSQLKALMSPFVDIHTQLAHQSIFDEKSHGGLLDAYAGEEFASQLKAYQKHYLSYRQLEKDYRELEKEDQADLKQVDFLKFQINEIEKADLKEEEDKQLEESFRQFSHYEKITKSLSKALEALGDGSERPSVVDSLGESLKCLEGLDQDLPELSKLVQQIEEVYYSLQDAESQLNQLFSSQYFDEEEYNTVQSRLFEIDGLKRKYGQSIKEILAYQSEAKAQIARYENRDQVLKEIAEQMAKEKAAALDLAKDLSQIRHLIAHQLEEDVRLQLADLYMASADFKVVFTRSELKIDGNETIRFDVKTNKGEPFKPLSKVASGGEASRLLLALKAILAKNMGFSTMIFDEIDTGVSGRVATAIGEKMAAIAKSSQVLAITHQAQVASWADHHMEVLKIEESDHTSTQVLDLSQEEHIEAIAKMQTDSTITELAVQQAKELVASANERKLLLGKKV
ncbi:DNA repair protein RecN [Atopobacter sp. AH10]|uniref:DNA repair protein RecN n=1 Tax=Atopobacter sp. AH10 TaxID=2315861 RepID=UPI000EF1862E|nr:DNA repair protein RecN [Atopobacter sp. AH10]RLK62524.1 DNA repair protein RecN [Atopobacter sp. AH10]